MCNGKWKQNGDFENVMDNTPSKLAEVTEEKIEHVLRISKKYLKKHFAQWCNQHLPLGLFTECESACIVARIIMIQPPLPANVHLAYNSPKHGREINLFEYNTFI